MKRIWHGEDASEYYKLGTDMRSSTYTFGALFGFIFLLFGIIPFTIIESAHSDVHRVQQFNSLPPGNRQIIIESWLYEDSGYGGIYINHENYTLYTSQTDQVLYQFPSIRDIGGPTNLAVLFIGMFLVFSSIGASIGHLIWRNRDYYLCSFPRTGQRWWLFPLGLFVIWPAIFISFICMKLDARTRSGIAAN